MKLAKLSLAAIVVAGLTSSSFAADTLADAFKNGKVNGELKAYYFDRDVGTADAGNPSTANLFTTGIMLNYKTASFYGLGANFTFQGNSSPFADKDAKSTKTASDATSATFIGDEYGTGAVLSEAYLSYTLGKTTALVGRMFLDTPLVATSGSKMTKDAFEGAAIINTDLPNTTLIAGYVQKHQDRTDNNGNIGKFSKTFGLGSVAFRPELKDGGYTLAAINKSIPGLTLTGAYANAIDIVQIAYAEAAYEGKAGEFGYSLAGQYYYNSFDDKVIAALGGEDNINAYGLKLGASFKGLNGYVAYAQVSNDDVATGGLVSGLGNGADLLYTSPVIGGAYYGPDSKSYAVDLNYDITAAANVGARYVEIKNDFDSEKYSFTSVYGYYKFEAALKGLKVGVEYEDKGKDADGQDLWVKAGYKF